MKETRWMNSHLFRKLSITLAIFAVMALAVMLLWNAIMPGITGVGTLNYLQALGLLVLCRLLVGGVGMRGFIPHAGMRERLRERWQAMSPEEREAFLQRPHGGRFRQDDRARRREPSDQGQSDATKTSQ